MARKDDTEMTDGFRIPVKRHYRILHIEGKPRRIFDAEQAGGTLYAEVLHTLWCPVLEERPDGSVVVSCPVEDIERAIGMMRSNEQDVARQVFDVPNPEGNDDGEGANVRDSDQTGDGGTAASVEVQPAAGSGDPERTADR